VAPATSGFFVPAVSPQATVAWDSLFAEQHLAPPPPNAVSGLLEITDKGHGFLRSEQRKFKAVPADPYVPADLIKRMQLRMGLIVTADTQQNKRGPGPLVTRVNQVNGKPLNDYHQMVAFPDLTVIDPRQAIRLETPGGPPSMRIMDLLAPIGRGQRGLIVAPPKTGKTTLLKEIAAATMQNHPDMKVFVLLIDERPEEVTDFRRSLPAEVWSSNSDEDVPSHVRTARMVIERARRMVEFGSHVLVILDSITRLGRAFNHFVGSSGRTMSGGIDAQAMQEPRAMFGSARNIEHGGSLTIIASALIDTGSRMDELIFQEFKGTGNMELVLSKKLAERRMWPAFDLPASGTRKEELLLSPEAVKKTAIMRRDLVARDPIQAMEALLHAMKKFPTNAEFLASF
jgi:transcription termination factor Rho